MREIFTIGFTKKSAAEFFYLLESHGVSKVVDVRLHNTSQLLGFSKGGRGIATCLCKTI